MKQNDALHFARELRKNQTASETFLWKLIRKKRLLGLRFLRQYRIEHDEWQRELAQRGGQSERRYGEWQPECRIGRLRLARRRAGFAYD